MKDLALSAEDTVALRTQGSGSAGAAAGTTAITELLRLNEHLYESFESFLDAVWVDRFEDEDEDDDDDDCDEYSRSSSRTFSDDEESEEREEVRERRVGVD